MMQISKLILWCVLLQIIAAASIGQDNYTYKSIRIFGESKIEQNLYEQFTLGKAVEDAQIIYMYQYSQTFDDRQPEISLDFNYPIEDSYDVDETQNLPLITQIQLYVKTEGEAFTQAYILGGGIGENNIRLRIVTNNSNLLIYMLVIYGKKPDNVEN